jgi:hypothetical protein
MKDSAFTMSAHVLTKLSGTGNPFNALLLTSGPGYLVKKGKRGAQKKISKKNFLISAS